MGLMGAVGSAAGGMILGVWGFAVLNVVGAALALGPLGLTLLRRPALISLSAVPSPPGERTGGGARRGPTDTLGRSATITPSLALGT